MTQITLITANGTKTTINAKDGDSLMQTAIANNIDGIVAECGGSMMCATCHVYIDEGFMDKLPPRSESEAEMLESTASPLKDNSRLSCQITIAPHISGLIVNLPEEQ